ncbi:MAG: branched-chain amino acid ABC transporter permease [Candidatus Bathyarchaeia archaeon]
MSYILPEVILFGSVFSLYAVSQTLRHNASGIPDFSITYYTGLGALAATTTTQVLGLNVYLSIPAAFALGCLLGAVYYHTVMRRMEKRGDSAVLRTLSTIGLSLLLGATAEIVYYLKPFGVWELMAYDFTVGELNGALIVSAALAALVTASLSIYLRRTTLGLTTRASEENPELAMVCGLDPWKIKLVSWTLSGGLAAVTGVLLPLFMCYVPSFDVTSLTTVFASSILGGFRSIPRVVLACFIVMAIQFYGIYFLQLLYGNQLGEWSQLIPIMVIVLSLLTYPRLLKDSPFQFTQ